MIDNFVQDDAMIPSQLMLQIDFDTPGTTANRKAIIMASYNIPDRQIAMVINNGDEVSRLQGSTSKYTSRRALRLTLIYHEQVTMYLLMIQRHLRSLLTSTEMRTHSRYVFVQSEVAVY